LWSLLIWFWNMKNTGKPIMLVTDNEWSGMLEMLLGLDGDSCGRLRQRTREKRMSTFSSRHLVSYSHVCESIFKNCLPTLMTRPSDGIIFTISFILLWIYYKFDLFLWVHTSILFEFVRVRNIPEQQCRTNNLKVYISCMI
jgi:hypothetical protein